jgi:hypothetical protein
VCAGANANGFGCQASCGCKGKCSNGAEAVQQRVFEREHVAKDRCSIFECIQLVVIPTSLKPASPLDE